MRVYSWKYLEAFPSYFDLQSVKSNVMEFILVFSRYESFLVVVGMDGYSIYTISRHIINLRMLPDVTTCEIESSDVLPPSNQHCWVIVDTDTQHVLCVCDTGYQSYFIWIYTEVEKITGRLILSHKCYRTILCDIDLPKANYS